jgi:hypothetical protein
MIPLIAIAGWVILVSQIAGLCLAASRGDRSVKAPGCDGDAGHAGRPVTSEPDPQPEAGRQG